MIVCYQDQFWLAEKRQSQYAISMQYPYLNLRNCTANQTEFWNDWCCVVADRWCSVVADRWYDMVADS